MNANEICNAKAPFVEAVEILAGLFDGSIDLDDPVGEVVVKNFLHEHGEVMSTKCSGLRLRSLLGSDPAATERRVSMNTNEICNAIDRLTIATLSAAMMNESVERRSLGHRIGDTKAVVNASADIKTAQESFEFQLETLAKAAAGRNSE